MRKTIDILKIVALCSVISVLLVITYTFVSVHLEDRAKVQVGERKLTLKLMNYKKQVCELEEVEGISPNGTTVRYKCGKTTIYATQKVVDIEVEMPPSYKSIGTN